MIHVDTSRLVELLPPGWLKKAARAQRDLDSASPEQAKKILKDKAHWRDLNKALVEASNHKCWYSEARPVGARMDVDHFRPKGAVREPDGSTRPGYPYLAYDFRNYRLAAQLMNQVTGKGANRRGKHDQFPLEAGAAGALGPEDLAAEKPLLLDPTIAGDPGLLTFDEQGKAKAAVEKAKDPTGYERATRTIEVLWLDYEPHSESRRVAWSEAHKAIKRAERCRENALRFAADGDQGEAATEWEFFRDELDRLRGMVQSTAEYSATARTCLRLTGPEWARVMEKRASSRPLRIGGAPGP